MLQLLKKQLRVLILVTCHAFLFGLIRGYFPQMGLMAVLARKVHLQVNIMLAGVWHVLMTFHSTICPVRPCPQMRVMTGIAIELHCRVLRDVYLDGLADRFLRGPEMRNIKSPVSDQLFSDA